MNQVLLHAGMGPIRRGNPRTNKDPANLHEHIAGVPKILAPPVPYIVEANPDSYTFSGAFHAAEVDNRLMNFEKVAAFEDWYKHLFISTENLNLGALSYGLTCIYTKLKLERTGLPGSAPTYGTWKPSHPTPRQCIATQTDTHSDVCLRAQVRWIRSRWHSLCRSRTGSWTRSVAPRAGQSS